MLLPSPPILLSFFPAFLLSLWQALSEYTVTKIMTKPNEHLNTELL